MALDFTNGQILAQAWMMSAASIGSIASAWSNVNATVTSPDVPVANRWHANITECSHSLLSRMSRRRSVAATSPDCAARIVLSTPKEANHS